MQDSLYMPHFIESSRVSVVIPTLNEARNLPHVFERLPENLFEVILVDGGSNDQTVEVARTLRPGIRVIGQTRSGKGNALACGFAACGGDIIVALDADGSTDPAEIPRFTTKLREGADYVKGSRYLEGGGSADITRLRHLGNTGLTRIVNALFGTRYTDLCYGYNAFWSCHLGALALDRESPSHTDGQLLWGDGFEIETLITLRFACAGLAVAEVPSYERQRINGDSNLRTLTDGKRVLTAIARQHWQRASRSTRRRKPVVHVVHEPSRPATVARTRNAVNETDAERVQ